MYEDALIILEQCLENFKSLFFNDTRQKAAYTQKTKLLLKTIDRITGGSLKKMDQEEAKLAKKKFKSLV